MGNEQSKAKERSMSVKIPERHGNRSGHRLSLPNGEINVKGEPVIQQNGGPPSLPVSRETTDYVILESDSKPASDLSQVASQVVETATKTEEVLHQKTDEALEKLSKLKDEALETVNQKTEEVQETINKTEEVQETINKTEEVLETTIKAEVKKSKEKINLFGKMFKKKAEDPAPQPPPAEVAIIREEVTPNEDQTDHKAPEESPPATKPDPESDSRRGEATAVIIIERREVHLHLKADTSTQTDKKSEADQSTQTGEEEENIMIKTAATEEDFLSESTIIISEEAVEQTANVEHLFPGIVIKDVVLMEDSMYESIDFIEEKVEMTEIIREDETFLSSLPNVVAECVEAVFASGSGSTSFIATDTPHKYNDRRAGDISTNALLMTEESGTLIMEPIVGAVCESPQSSPADQLKSTEDLTSPPVNSACKKVAVADMAPEDASVSRKHEKLVPVTIDRPSKKYDLCLDEKNIILSPYNGLITIEELPEDTLSSSEDEVKFETMLKVASPDKDFEDGQDVVVDICLETAEISESNPVIAEEDANMIPHAAINALALDFATTSITCEEPSMDGIIQEEFIVATVFIPLAEEQEGSLEVTGEITEALSAGLIAIPDSVTEDVTLQAERMEEPVKENPRTCEEELTIGVSEILPESVGDAMKEVLEALKNIVEEIAKESEEPEASFALSNVPTGAVENLVQEPAEEEAEKPQMDVTEVFKSCETVGKEEKMNAQVQVVLGDAMKETAGPSTVPDEYIVLTDPNPSTSEKLSQDNLLAQSPNTRELVAKLEGKLKIMAVDISEIFGMAETAIENPVHESRMDATEDFEPCVPVQEGFVEENTSEVAVIMGEAGEETATSVEVGEECVEQVDLNSVVSDKPAEETPSLPLQQPLMTGLMLKFENKLESVLEAVSEKLELTGNTVKEQAEQADMPQTDAEESAPCVSVQEEVVDWVVTPVQVLLKDVQGTEGPVVAATEHVVSTDSTTALPDEIKDSEESQNRVEEPEQSDETQMNEDIQVSAVEAPLKKLEVSENTVEEPAHEQADAQQIDTREDSEPGISVQEELIEETGTPVALLLEDDQESVSPDVAIKESFVSPDKDPAIPEQPQDGSAGFLMQDPTTTHESVADVVENLEVAEKTVEEPEYGQAAVPQVDGEEELSPCVSIKGRLLHGIFTPVQGLFEYVEDSASSAVAAIEHVVLGDVTTFSSEEPAEDSENLLTQQTKNTGFMSKLENTLESVLEATSDKFQVAENIVEEPVYGKNDASQRISREELHPCVEDDLVDSTVITVGEQLKDAEETTSAPAAMSECIVSTATYLPGETTEDSASPFEEQPTTMDPDVQDITANLEDMVEDPVHESTDEVQTVSREESDQVLLEDVKETVSPPVAVTDHVVSTHVTTAIHEDPVEDKVNIQQPETTLEPVAQAISGSFEVTDDIAEKLIHEQADVHMMVAGEEPELCVSVQGELVEKAATPVQVSPKVVQEEHVEYQACLEPTVVEILVYPEVTENISEEPTDDQANKTEMESKLGVPFQEEAEEGNNTPVEVLPGEYVAPLVADSDPVIAQELAGNSTSPSEVQQETKVLMGPLDVVPKTETEATEDPEGGPDNGQDCVSQMGMNEESEPYVTVIEKLAEDNVVRVEALLEEACKETVDSNPASSEESAKESSSFLEQQPLATEGLTEQFEDPLESVEASFERLELVLGPEDLPEMDAKEEPEPCVFIPEELEEIIVPVEETANVEASPEPEPESQPQTESTTPDPSPEEEKAPEPEAGNSQPEEQKESIPEENTVMNFFKTLVTPTKTAKKETAAPAAAKEQESQPAETTTVAQVSELPAAPKGMSIPPPPPPEPPKMEIKAEPAAKPAKSSPKVEPKAAAKEPEPAKGKSAKDTLSKFFRPKVLLGVKASKGKGASRRANASAKTAAGTIKTPSEPTVEVDGQAVIEGQETAAEVPESSVEVQETPAESPEPVVEVQSQSVVEPPKAAAESVQLTVEEQVVADVEVPELETETQKVDPSKAGTLEAAAKPEPPPPVQEEKKAATKSAFLSMFKPKAADPKKATPVPPAAAEAAQTVKEEPKAAAKAPEAAVENKPASGAPPAGDEAASMPRLEKRNSIHKFFRNLGQKRGSTDAGVQTEAAVAAAAEKAK